MECGLIVLNLWSIKQDLGTRLLYFKVEPKICLHSNPSRLHARVSRSELAVCVGDILYRGYPIITQPSFATRVSR